MVLQRIAPLAFRAAPWPLAGARPTLVCIHGSGGDHSLWGAQVEGLSAVANVVAVDLPGHGASGGTALDSVSEYARVLAPPGRLHGRNCCAFGLARPGFTTLHGRLIQK